jgi:hypothetical protein
VLASFAIIDTATHDRAVEIAARIVAAVGDTVEIRPVPDGPDGPDNPRGSATADPAPGPGGDGTAGTGS